MTFFTVRVHIDDAQEQAALQMWCDVLNYIKETVSFEFPGITLCNIKFFISNFEPAILGEMTVAFPSAVTKVCWFYYGQAIYRKASELGFLIAYKQKGVVYQIVKEIIALTFLPAKGILEGFQVYIVFAIILILSGISMKLILQLNLNLFKNKEFRLCSHTTGTMTW